jgi:hypothetical protein
VLSDFDQDVVPEASWYAPESTRTSTFETLLSSEEVPDTVNVPLTVAPSAGLEIQAFGATESAAARIVTGDAYALVANTVAAISAPATCASTNTAESRRPT